MRLVTIYNTFNAADAQLIRSRLEAAHIPATVAHELSALSMEGYTLGAGGIEVRVAEEHAEEARAILAAKDDSDSEADETAQP